jgi:hypothetical protein
MDLPDKNNLFSLLRILGLLGGILILVQAAFILIIGIIVGTVSIGIVHVTYNGPIPLVIALVLALVIIGLIIGGMVILESNQIVSSGTMRPFIVLLILGIISLFLDSGFVLGAVLVIIVAIIGISVYFVLSMGISLSPFHAGNRVCPSCGFISSGNANYCPSCGRSFKEEKAT